MYSRMTSRTTPPTTSKDRYYHFFDLKYYNENVLINVTSAPQHPTLYVTIS